MFKEGRLIQTCVFGLFCNSLKTCLNILTRRKYWPRVWFSEKYVCIRMKRNVSQSMSRNNIGMTYCVPCAILRSTLIQLAFTTIIGWMDQWIVKCQSSTLYKHGENVCLSVTPSILSIEKSTYGYRVYENNFYFEKNPLI